MAFSHGKVSYKLSGQTIALTITAKPRESTSIKRSSITVPNIDERDKFSHLPIKTARAISPSFGVTQFTPYPIISEPKRFFIFVSGLTEDKIIFHLKALI